MPDLEPHNASLGPLPVDPLATIAAAAAGLNVASEIDAQLSPVRLGTSPWPPNPRVLREVAGLPADVPVEARPLDDFFRHRADLARAADEPARAEALRFATLRNLIATQLAEPAVFRVGASEVHVFILGRAGDGSALGLRTLIVEA